MTTNRWFGIRLDTFGAIFVASLVFTSIPLSDGNNHVYSYMMLSFSLLFLVIDPALMGLSLAYGVSLSNIVQYSVRLSAEVENLVRNLNS